MQGTTEYLDNVSRIGMVGGGGAATVGWWTSIDWIATIGVIVLVATFFVNLIFRVREDRRKQERHEMEMARLREDI